MAEGRITPVDTLSGLPYLLAPFGGDNITKHHAWHPSDHPFLQTPDGQALRISLLQDIDASIHNEGPKPHYHKNKLYIGPILPETQTDTLVPVFFATAGAISRYCIDFSGEEPVEREITPAEKEYLQTPHIEGGYQHLRHGYLPIRSFFKRILLDQNVLHLDSMVDQFLSSSDEEKKEIVGLELMEEAARVAIDGLHQRYNKLRSLGLLYPWGFDRPEEVIMHQLGNKKRRVEILPEFELKLAKAS